MSRTRMGLTRMPKKLERLKWSKWLGWNPKNCSKWFQSIESRSINYPSSRVTLTQWIQLSWECRIRTRPLQASQSWILSPLKWVSKGLMVDRWFLFNSILSSLTRLLTLIRKRRFMSNTCEKFSTQEKRSRTLPRMQKINKRSRILNEHGRTSLKRTFQKHTGCIRNTKQIKRTITRSYLKTASKRSEKELSKPKDWQRSQSWEPDD